MDIIEILTDIDGLPQYKNALSYHSSDWRELSACTVKYPVQRKLTMRECVFDFDDLCEEDFTRLINYMETTGLKFMAWRSGPAGMHVHFWTQIVGKLNKKKLVQHMAKKIESIFGIKNDIGPMGHQAIRAEYSFHPEHKYQKSLIKSTLTDLFMINQIGSSILAAINIDDKIASPNASMKDGKIPTCVRYMLTHKFTDCRKRMVFVLVSWFKANKLPDDIIYQRISKWCRDQDFNYPANSIWACIKSSNGEVGCTYRHELLAQVGVDMMHCKYE